MSLPRNVLILGLCQALALAGATLVIFAGGILGSTLAPAPSLATLPIATFVIGNAVNTVPAALWMRRAGRRTGFMTGAALGMLAGAVGGWAVLNGSFALFCTGTALVGASTAFAQQYRFAAAESVDPGAAGRAVSMVLFGGVIAGFLGPELARRTRQLLPVEYAATFFAMAAVYLIVGLLLTVFRDIAAAADARTAAPPRPLREIAREPGFALAVGAGVVAFGVMSFIMIATPVSMRIMDGHSVDATAAVIQAHVIAMYVPSLFTGYLIDRLGARRMMTLGALAMIVCVLITQTGHHVHVYGGALVLLGIGWNFLFVGGTVQLTTSYRPEDRFRAQAFNDFMVFGIQAAAALTAGAVLHRFGWLPLNRMAVVPLLLMIALLALARTERPPEPALPAPAATR